MRRTVLLALAVALVVAPACNARGPLKLGGGPERGGTLRLGIERLVSLDPGQARTADELLVADQLFDTLTSVRPGAAQARPELASGWDVTADQRNWDFTLKPDARFANGRQVTSADVKYSFERVARRSAASPAGELLELVAGYVPFADGSTDDLSGITTPSPEVVRISLDQPWSVLPIVLASPVLGIVPRESVEAAPPAPSFDDQPIGSGPFRIDERAPQHLVLVPRPGSTVFLDRLDFTEYDSVAASYRTFVDGSLDWSRVPGEQVEQAARRFGDDGYLPLDASLFYGLNSRAGALADARVREALVRGVDRSAIVRAVYQSTVRPSNGVLSKGVPGFRSEPCERCRHSTARARVLLGEVYPAGDAPSLHVDVDDDPSQLPIAQAMVEQLDKIGIEASVRVHPAADYQAFVASGQQEIFRMGWVAAYPSPDAILPPLFAKGSPSNLTGFDGPAVDEVLRAARAEPDPTRRAALYEAAERDVLGAFPVIPLAQLMTHTVGQPTVRGIELDGRGGFDASKVWLAK